MRKALKDAGLVPDVMDGASGTEFNGGAIPAGISAQVGANEKGGTASLANAMTAAGLIDKPMSASINPVRDNGFDITIAPAMSAAQSDSRTPRAAA